MSSSPSPYERLTRPRFGLNGMGALWLAKDHLLLVTNSFAVEGYRRWYFREIQAIVIRKTSSRMIWNSILGAFTLMLLAAAGACLAGSGTATSSEDIMVLSVMAAIFAFVGFGLMTIAAINTGMGPACNVFIQTPHGLDRLSTPNRVLAVEKLIARLQPLLIAAQSGESEKGGALREIAAILDQPLS